MFRLISAFIVGTALLGASSKPGATPIVFFGEDLATGRTVPPTGNAASARSNFLNRLLEGVGVEDFERFDPFDTPPYGLTFPGSSGDIMATLANVDGICDETDNCPPPASGEFATSGDRWVFTSQSLALSFNDPIAAFGFFGTDIGDFGAQLTITLTELNGGQVAFDVPHTIGSRNDNGDLLFWGFIDPTTTYLDIQFGLTGGAEEFFGFDDMTVGDMGQLAIPEPTTVTLIGLALVALLGTRRNTADQTVRSSPYPPVM